MTIEEAIKHFEAQAQCNYAPTHEAAQMATSALRAQQTPLNRGLWAGCAWCKTYGLGAVVFDEQKYCGYCGRPLTEEAWAELERRINNGPNDLCKASAQLEPRAISH